MKAQLSLFPVEKQKKKSSQIKKQSNNKFFLQSIYDRLIKIQKKGETA